MSPAIRTNARMARWLYIETDGVSDFYATNRQIPALSSLEGKVDGYA